MIDAVQDLLQATPPGHLLKALLVQGVQADVEQGQPCIQTTHSPLSGAQYWTSNELNNMR